MNYIVPEGQRQCCAFGFFDMEGNLIGYRQDTFNTVGIDFAKVYTYTKSQVKTVLDNINASVTSDKNWVAEILKCCGYTGKEVAVASNTERNTRNEFKKLGEFEVRVIPAPEHAPFEPVDLGMWLLQAPSLEPLESFKFSL